jgi:flagellin-like hook-associated protein FlgL
MHVSSSSPVRVGELQRTQGAASQIARTQQQLADVTKQLTTGRRVNVVSDAPADAATAQQIRRDLELSVGYDNSLSRADRMLSRTDQVLADATDLLREARQIGLANVGDQSSNDERQGAAVVLRTIESQLLNLANTTEGGIALFGGTGNASGSDPFASRNGGIVFTGTDDANVVGVGSNGKTIATGVQASDVFGGNSRRVGTLDLDPSVSAATRLSELGGSRDLGVARGSIRLTNAGTSEVIDLSNADTLGDVAARINASSTGVTASLVAGDRLQLSGTSVTVGEVGGATAGDLGILNSVPTGTVVGEPLNATVTTHTPIGQLNGGAGISAGTITINNGDQTTLIDTSGLATVGDLVNTVNAANAGVTATISDDGSRVLLQNATQGSDLRVTGGPAFELGWLTFTTDDPVADYNGGRGIGLDPDGPDLRIEDAGGVTFEVNLDDATNATQVIAAINAAATTAGASTVATFDNTLPGYRLTGVNSVSNTGSSSAATGLGIDGGAVANTVEGRDVNAVRVDGPFTHLQQLIRALEVGDTGSGNAALASLEKAERQVVSVRGENGGNLREVQDRRDRLAETDLTRRELLSRLEDADYSATILEYQTLQNSLQAQLQTSAQLLNLSLFDFLR